jgi:chromodomain-helicase-DNA-binding protein 1
LPLVACIDEGAALCSLSFPLGSFDKDDSQQNQKLDEMDLDDILKTAEQHETMAANNEGASLGGEGFLAQFANVSDVKNDMNWEDIIPLEERQKFEEEEATRKAEELAAQERESKDRKRSHAPVSYEGMDVELPAPAPAPKKPKHPAPQRKTASQKAMELKERDVRVLIRSLQRWGDIRQRYDVIVCTFHASFVSPLTRCAGRGSEAQGQKPWDDHRHC